MRYLLIVLILAQSCFGGTIAHWKMNDNTSSAVIKDSIDGHDGTFYDENTPKTVTSDHATTGQVNGGLDFDGTNDYATFSDHADFSPVGSPFSIAAWISIGHEGATEFLILDKWETNKYEWQFIISGDALYFHLYDVSASAQIGRVDTADYSAWESAGFIFVVATYDGGASNSSVKLYLNGEQSDDSDSENNPESFVAVENNDAVLRMALASGSPNKAIGVIDNVAVFDTELTQSQITTLYNDSNGTEDLTLGSRANLRARYSDGYRSIYRSRYNYQE